MKRLLVTGATGFVGQHLMPVLAKEYELWCVVRERQQLQSRPGAIAIEADLSDPGFVRHLPDRVDGILHMAVAPPSLAPAPSHAFQVNAASTLSLLEWGKNVGIERFVFTSSGSVYGAQPGPIDEDVPPRPADLLGVAKAAAEMLTGLYTSDMAVVVLRLWRPYGPGQPDHFLIPRLAARIRAGEPITLHRGGHPQSNAIYIDDLVEVMQRALHFEGAATLNVAHPEVHSIRELCSELEAVLGRPAVYRETDRDVGDLIADVSRMEEMLGYRPRVPLAEGLRRMWQGAG